MIALILLNIICKYHFYRVVIPAMSRNPESITRMTRWGPGRPAECAREPGMTGTFLRKASYLNNVFSSILSQSELEEAQEVGAVLCGLPGLGPSVAVGCPLAVLLEQIQPFAERVARPEVVVLLVAVFRG